MDIVANAVSPKAAADLSSMKKADAAAAAELRLANAHWLPEVLTHREVPVINHYDADNEGNAADTQDGTGDEIDGGLNGELGDDPDSANSSEADVHYHDDPASTDASEDQPVIDDSTSITPPAWPFPTSTTISRRHAAR